MHLDRRLTAGLCGALAVFAGSRAHAQPVSPAPVPPKSEPAAPSPAAPSTAQPPSRVSPPEAAAAPAPPTAAPAPPTSESLETPYVDLPPPPTPAAPVTPAEPRRVVPRGAPDKRPQGPIRAQRRLALLGEIGWNGLAGFGAVLAYNANPHLAFDLAGGFSLLGWKGGLRARYNILARNMTPFVGVGFNATSGLGEFTSDPKDRDGSDPNAVPFTLDVKASYLVQYVVGFDFLHRRGFNMVGALGYAQLLNHDNIRVVDGQLTDEERRAVNIIFKGGLVLSLAAGYAFE
jgi:hypothetical protein